MVLRRHTATQNAKACESVDEMKPPHDVTPEIGNGNEVPAAETPQTPQATPAPPAATVVANAPTERERELAAELAQARKETEEERLARVEREVTICEMQDEHHRYRKSVESKPKSEPRKNSWTFFDND